MGIGAVLGELTPDGEGRVDTAGLQRDREHRRRRGLAVGASDRDPSTSAHDRCQRLRAVQNPQPPGSGSPQLDVVLTDGGGDDNGVGIREKGGVVTDMDIRSLSGQGRQHERVLGVGPTHAHSPGKHHPGDAGHSRATDCYEVDRPQTAGGGDLGSEVETTVRACDPVFTR